MIRLRPSDERGSFDHGWLKTYHSFSFGDYNDPQHMGFRSLRVLNEDWVAPSHGFGKHGHRDMEMITIVLSGTLQHGDSMGHSAPIRPGEVQRMSAGTGVLHSEANPSTTEEVHLLQVWIVPDRRGHQPSYEQITVDPASTTGRWGLLASPDGLDGSVTIHQDARLYLAHLDETASPLRYDLAPGRHAWLQVTRGTLTVNGRTLNAGDGAAVTDEPTLDVKGNAELLLFDLA